MKFSVNQKDLQESLSFCQNVIERRSTLPILSNVLLEASGKELIIIHYIFMGEAGWEKLIF